MTVRIAILDMDGTLVSGFVAGTFVQELRTLPGADHAAVNEALDLLRRYRDREITHEACARGFYPAYGRALRGLSAPLLRELGVRAWKRHRDALFPHARPLVSLLRTHGLEICLISGSPAEALAPAAVDLGVDRFWGSTAELRGGVATGRLLCSPALPGGKRAILDGLGRETPVAWGASFAIGDSASDVEALGRVGLPLAFEPDPALRRVATGLAWPVADRDTVLDLVHVLLNGAREQRARG